MPENIGSAEDVSASELAAFLRSHRDPIVRRWLEIMADRPAVKGLSLESLIDHIPALLEAIAETGEARLEDPHARLGPESAERHALERLVEGADLPHVVVELAVLRDCVLELWDQERKPGAARPEVRFLNRSVDRAITASIERYVSARDRTLLAIDRISAAALETRRLDDLLERLLGVLLETTPAVDTGVILLREGDSLVVRAVVGLEEEVHAGLSFKVGEGFAGRVAAEARPLFLADTEDGEVHSPLLRAMKLRCLYGVPLMEDGHVVGVAHVGSLTAPSFSEQDKRLFQAMAARATSGITQHQLREEAERRAAESAAVIESIPDALFIGDAGGIRTANRAALKMLGVGSAEEMNARSEEIIQQFEVRRVATGEPAPREVQPFARALSGEEVTDELAVRNLRTEQQLTLRVAAAPIRKDSRTIGAVMVATDVTARNRGEEERRLLYDRAQQAVADREHALAVVSHDLRQPLNMIGIAASMLDTELDSGPARKTIDSIKRAVRRMSRLIADLVDFSSIQAGRLSVTLAPIDAASVVEEVLEGARHDVEARGLALRKAAAPLLIRADRDRLLQALGNLVANAAKATAEGSITVSVADGNNQAVFAVVDTGPGIPQEERARLFEPYWRTKNPSYKGTGLGLAITQAIVQAHGGRIWVDSVPGGGAAFYFTIPRVVA